MKRAVYVATVVACALALIACLGGTPGSSAGPTVETVDYPPGFDASTVDPAAATDAVASADAYVLRHRTNHSIALSNGSTHRSDYNTTYWVDTTTGEAVIDVEHPGGPQQMYVHPSFDGWTPTYRVDEDRVSLTGGERNVSDGVDPTIDKSSNLTEVLAWFRWNATRVDAGGDGNAALIRYRASKFTSEALERSPPSFGADDVAFFGASLREYRDVNASLVVDTDGRFHRFAFRGDRYRRSYPEPEYYGTMRTSATVTYPGDLDVERPGWVDRAEELAD